MEAVREVEEERRDDDDDQQNDDHCLPVLDEDGLEDVRRVLAGVDGVLEPLVDVLPPDDGDRVSFGMEQLGHAVANEPVAFVLELLELLELQRGVVEPVEALDSLVEA